MHRGHMRVGKREPSLLNGTDEQTHAEEINHKAPHVLPQREQEKTNLPYSLTQEYKSKVSE